MIDRSFQIDPESDLYAVIGSPIAHSLSPLIHNTAFESLNLNGRYGAFEVAPVHLRSALEEAKSSRFKGLNITIPLKEAILAMLDEVKGEAIAIGAVNTVSFDGQKTVGYNTDAKGFADSILAYRDRLAGRKVLVIGAGGAARAVIYALIHTVKAGGITIVNRTGEKAARLADSFGVSSVRPGLIGDADPAEFAMIVNATSVGLRSHESPLDPGFFLKEHIAYDLIYSPRETRFLADAKRAGATVIHGLEMLLGQAAAAFEIWTGCKMPVQQIRLKLETVLAV